MSVDSGTKTVETAPSRVTPLAAGDQSVSEAGGGADRLKTVALEAMAEIDKTPNKSRAAARYSAPWFLFIGDADEATGLLSLARRPGVAGRGRPERTGWAWHLLPRMVGVTIGDALICDPKSDKDNWRLLEAALELLTRQRPKLPMDGVVVTVTVETLLDEADAGLRGEQLRMVVNEAYRDVRSDLPVHLIVSGLDRLLGHAGFFAALPSRIADQALGYLNDPPSPLGESIKTPLAAFDELVQRLEAVRLGLLQDLRADIDRFSVFRFVEELSRLRRGLEIMERSLFGVDRWGHKVVWRGFWLTAPGAPGREARHAHDVLDRFLPGDAGLIQPK